MTFYIKGAEGSKWSDPFNVKKYGRENIWNYIENI